MKGSLPLIAHGCRLTLPRLILNTKWKDIFKLERDPLLSIMLKKKAKQYSPERFDRKSFKKFSKAFFKQFNIILLLTLTTHNNKTKNYWVDVSDIFVNFKG